jgi:phosphatidylserine decarboxylase
MRKKDEDITESEKAEAKRRIEGSITPRNEGEVGGGLPIAATMAG